MADERIRVYCESLGDGRYLHRPKDPLCACGAVPLFQLTKTVTVPILVGRAERKIDHAAILQTAVKRGRDHTYGYHNESLASDVALSVAEALADFAVEMIRRDRDGAL